MKLKESRILLVSPEPWSHIFVSKHHYAIHLAARGNNVFFLNPPSKLYKKSVSKFNSLSVLDYSGFWPGLRFLPKFLRRLNQRTVFSKLQGLAGGQFDIIWSFDNSVFFDFDVLPQAVLKISHIVDLNQDFETKRAASSADICLGVIEPIVKRLNLYNKRSFLIGHGVATYQNLEKIELPGNNRLKALYFGNLAMPDLNWTLLEKASLEIPHLDFILMGPNHQVASIDERENLFFLEAVMSDQLPSYMAASDVLFLFYQRSYNDNYASPHKVLEYLLSGKPIISTPINGYEDNELLYIADEGDWTNQLMEILNTIDSVSGLDKVRARIDYALSFSYDRQIDRIEDYIEVDTL